MAYSKVKLLITILVFSMMVLFAQKRPNTAPAVQMTYNACVNKCEECKDSNVIGKLETVMMACKLRICFSDKTFERKYDKFSIL